MPKYFSHGRWLWTSAARDLHSLEMTCTGLHPSRSINIAVPAYLLLHRVGLQATRVNAAEMTGSLPPRVQRILNAGLFTPRVGRLAAAQRFVMPPALHDVHPAKVGRGNHAH